jgi:hypothetical protein
MREENSQLKAQLNAAEQKERDLYNQLASVGINLRAILGQRPMEGPPTGSRYSTQMAPSQRNLLQEQLQQQQQQQSFAPHSMLPDGFAQPGQPGQSPPAPTAGMLVRYDENGGITPLGVVDLATLVGAPQQGMQQGTFGQRGSGATASPAVNAGWQNVMEQEMLRISPAPSRTPPGSQDTSASFRTNTSYRDWNQGIPTPPQHPQTPQQQQVQGDGNQLSNMMQA